MLLGMGVKFTGLNETQKQVQGQIENHCFGVRALQTPAYSKWEH
jgi:hypothetical protein